MELFERAAFTFGHFDSVYEVGTRHLIGRHPQHDRNVHQALRFLEPSAAGGEWGGKVRCGRVNLDYDWFMLLWSVLVCCTELY